MASVSLATLRTRAKSRCDKANDSFVSDSEWNTWLNAGLDELHGLLVRTGEPYKESSSSFTTSGVETVALPADFFRATGVDLQVSGLWFDLDSFDWDDRNRLRNVPSSTGRESRYCIRGGNLILLPVPPSGLSGRLNYTPQRTQLSGDSDTFDGVNGWEEFAVVHAAKKALEKGEEDASHLQAELLRLQDRIQREAAIRDSEKPPRVKDSDDGVIDIWAELRPRGW